MVEGVLAIVCPGQGSQKPGMLRPWLDASPDAVELAASLGQACGLDLVALGCDADADEIRDTAVAQPLIVATSLVAAHVVGLSPAPAGSLVAGHSVGEFAAVALAGVLSVPDAVRLVGVRGAAMATAARCGVGGMSAVLGGDPDDVLATLEQLGLTAANFNGSGQIVAAGRRDALEQLAAAPPQRARVMPLQVAGAFHSPLMEPAIRELDEACAQTTWNDTAATWLSDADGQPVHAGSEVRQRLVAQITAPVRWDQVTDTLSARDVTGVLELAPSGVLTGLARRAMPSAERLAVTSPADATAVRDFVAAHLTREA